MGRIFLTTHNTAYLIIKLMRPQQWYKNIIIFLALIFSGNLFNAQLILKNIIGFTLFCIISSGVYIINDIIDAKSDATHPVKRKRPIASGLISARIAALASTILLGAGMLFSFLLNPLFFIVVSIYIIQSVIYSMYFKKLKTLGIIIIGLGFVWRAVAGAILLDVYISPWLVICTYLMALTLNSGKKIIDFQNNNAVTLFYEKTLVVSLSALLLSFVLYVAFTNQFLFISIPFATWGLFRYLEILYSRRPNEFEKILEDPQILAALGLWGASIVLVIYGGMV